MTMPRASHGEAQASPVRDGHNAGGASKAGLEDVHVLAADGVVQPEQLCVDRGGLRRRQNSHGPPPLVRDVVDDEDAPRKRHLVVIPVVRLHADQASSSQDRDRWPLGIACRLHHNSQTGWQAADRE